MKLVLPQSYSTGRVIRIPVRPQTVGDHIRERRLALKMLQRKVADQLGVNKTTVYNWEPSFMVLGCDHGFVPLRRHKKIVHDQAAPVRILLNYFGRTLVPGVSLRFEFMIAAGGERGAGLQAIEAMHAIATGTH